MAASIGLQLAKPASGQVKCCSSRVGFEAGLGEGSFSWAGPRPDKSEGVYLAQAG